MPARRSSAERPNESNGKGCCREVCGLATHVSQPRGIKDGWRNMVRGAIHNLFYSLRQIRGGWRSIPVFLGVLKEVERTGLFVLEDALYDNRTGSYCGRTAHTGVLEHVWQARLGKAGRVSITPCIWEPCVPPDLIDIYRRHASTCAPRARSHTSQHARLLCAMFHSIHRLMKGVCPTCRALMASAFLGRKNANKCQCLLNATAINDTDARRPPRVRLPALSSIFPRFAHTHPKPICMCKLDSFVGGGYEDAIFKYIPLHGPISEGGADDGGNQPLANGGRILPPERKPGVSPSGDPGVQAKNAAPRTRHPYAPIPIGKITREATQTVAEALRTARFIISNKSMMEPQDKKIKSIFWGRRLTLG